MNHRLRRLAFVLAVSAAAAAPLGAEERDVSAYAVTAWTSESGLPREVDSVVAITQDQAGYLWLGTSRGLVRFDGSDFVLWGARGEPALPGSGIRALATGRDGALWIAYNSAGGVSRIRQGELVHYSEREGLRGDAIQAVIEDRGGTVWIGGQHGLMKFQDGVWQAVGPEQGVPQGQVFSLYEDRRGRLWVGTDAGVVSRAPDDQRFVTTDPQRTFVQSFVEDLSGTIWGTDAQRLVHPIGRGPQPAYPRPLRLPLAGWRLQTDARGTVWAAALGSGLLRVREGSERATAVVEPFSDPRITGSVQAVYVDREDNVWVGMRGGLLRLSESIVVNVTPLAGLLNEGVRGLTVSGDGSVWVATSYALNRFGPKGPQTFDIEQTQALHTDRSGTVWVVTLRGISRYSGGRFVPLSMPRGFRFEGILSFTSDGAGGLWFCNFRAGLARWDRDGLNWFEDVPAVARRPCGSTYTDRGGRVWIGFTTGGVAAYENGRFETFGEKEGLGAGNVTAILEDRAGAIWVSTSGGISRFQGGGFITLTSRNGLPDRIGASLAEDDAGFLWASVGTGIVRFDSREPDRVRANPDYQVPYALYDRSDGLPAALGSLSRPSSVRGDGGTLWFATTSGVFVIEPRRLGAGNGTASVRVENVLADGRPLDSTRLPAAAPPDSMIEVAYTAVSLSTATKLRFRHKLDGFDRDWTYAGGRRQASYANLAPGDYRFRVAATNDGLWKEPEAVFDFTVWPPFYQANWFYVSCAAVLGLTAWAYWQVRLRTVRSNYALVFAERARVSRDIHDTLLQSLSAVGLELEVVARVVSASHPAATDTVRALQRRVAECIRETRQSVWDLRSPTLEHKGLGEALREVAANAATASTARIDVSEGGQARPFPHQAQEELLRIAREAITNAVRHAHPTHVTVELAYEPDTVLLRVTDDGCGFVPASVPKGSEHCGLVNMRERAAALKGTLRIASTPGSGTVIEAAVPLSPPAW